MRLAHTVIVPIALGVVMACQAEPEAELEHGTHVALRPGLRSVPVSVVGERPMSHRREGQGLLDSARTALVGRDAALTVTLLHRAAEFFSIQANAPPSGGTGDLLATANSLDSLAREVKEGRLADTTSLDRLSTHANLAEAERHGALAAVAWSVRSKESVGDELTMAADHVERAAVDAKIALPPAMRRLLAELRALVLDLSARRELDLHELDEPLANLHMEIHAMHTRLERDARADVTTSMSAPPA